jgi:threonine synthase
VAVPTGNFGNVFAGYAARRMGVPIERLVVASNTNDILTRFAATGEMAVAGVVPTLSPSMDIQVSSNFERLLFDLMDRDGAAVAQAMDRFKQSGRFAVSEARLARFRAAFQGARYDDAQTLAEIRRTERETGMLLCPHTAIGLAAARDAETDPGRPTVALATAHPAKFPDAVAQATGQRPPLPERLADLYDRPEAYTVLPADLDAVEHHVRQNSRRTAAVA